MEKFNRETNGYNVEEVNRFLDSVIVNTESLVNRVKFQNNKIISLEKELKVYKNLEDSLKTTLLEASKTASIIKENATKDSELIIRDANLNARKIMNDALVRTEKINFRADTMERNMVVFKRKLKTILDEQQSIIDDIDKLVLK